MNIEPWVMIMTEETEVLGEKAAPAFIGSTLSYRNGLGQNTGLHGKKPATNRLIHG
jgi:hypothetical protein